VVRFEEVNEENWRLGLKVSQEQKEYVADCATLLARAYAYRNQRSRAYVIYDGDVPVGMALYYDCEPLNAFDFSQLFIDWRYQGRGLGLAAAQAVLEMMRQDGKYQKVVLCYKEGNLAAGRLYEKLGFTVCDVDGDEIVMEKAL